MMAFGRFILCALLPLCGNSLAVQGTAEDSPQQSNHGFTQQQISASGSIMESRSSRLVRTVNDVSKSDTHALLRREDNAKKEAPAESACSSACTNCEDAYGNLVRAHSDIVGYMRFDDENDFEKDEENNLNWNARGNVAFAANQGLICEIPCAGQTCAGHHAAQFEEATGNNQMLDMSDSNKVNTDSSGYPQRSIDFWFKATDISANHGLQTIYEEGGSVRGIHVYLWGRMLNVFMYNRAEKSWGKDDEDPEGFFCMIDQGDTYYFAFTFEGEVDEPSYKAYIKKAGTAGDIELCGNKHIREDKDSNYRNDIELRSHPGDVGIGGVNGKSRISGYDEGLLNHDLETPFIGLVDEFAIYNELLSESDLNAHYHAGSPAS